ncbi:MAG: DUF3011 domain-containing protein [Steroidobacteraceae bacterium]
MKARAIGLGILLAGALALAPAEVPAQSSSVTCESNDGHEKFCPADTRGGVILSAQLSKASCRQGVSWGYDDRGIWTSNGCRARFTTGSTSDDGWEDHQRRSGDQGNHAAAAVAAVALLAVGAAAVHEKHEDDRRDRERNYNDRGGYYDYQPNNGYRYPSDYNRDQQTIRCESNDGRQRFCPIDIGRARVELTRQLSRGECRFARNWGYDRRGVWVNDGCRGEFTVYY